MALSFDDLRTRDGDTIDRDYLNKRWQLIVNGVNANATKIDTLSAAENNLITLGLERINQVLGPTINKIAAAAEIGFLVETSKTLFQMQANTRCDIAIDNNSARDIFAPTPHLLVSDNTNIDNWAVVDLLSWTRTTGTLSFRPVYINGSGYGNDWTIAGTVGVIPAMINTLASAQAIKTDILAAQSAVAADKTAVASNKTATDTAKNTAVSAANSATAAAGQAASSASNAASSATAAAGSATNAATSAAAIQAALATGPVTSVNSKTGSVTLTASDVSAYSKAEIDAKLATIDSGTF